MSALPAYVSRYRICREIGRGSFATVALAWDEELESSVALKILDVSDPDIEQRFLNEARLLRRVRAPNVVAVHDIGRLNDSRPYFVLDYADRGTLADRLPYPCHLLNLSAEGQASSSRNIPAGQELEELQALLLLVDALADGLSAIHAAGLVHRDIKPGNILFESVRRSPSPQESNRDSSNGPLISSSERALVADLGIAKDLRQGSEQPTILGGTPLFLAPEQLEANTAVSSTADIYSASAIIWNVLTGCPPPMPDRLQAALQTLPENWQSIMATGLQREPDSRYQSMDEWRWAIHDLVGNAGRTVMYEPALAAAHVDECPYKGLAAYQPEDAEFFCGRETLTDELLRRLQLHDVLVVGGPSGSGKSSLVRAGLIPAVEAGSLPGSEKWLVQIMTPGSEPQSRLAVPDRESIDRLLVIDQFEELFTLCQADVRAAFLDHLAMLTESAEARFKLVIVVRADFYGECAREQWLAGRITNNQVLVGPMSASELRQAIAEPARRCGYFLERGLLEAILEQAGSEAGALPLVAHALVETWVRREGNTLTLAGFESAGGVAGAISQTADAAYEHQLDEAGRMQTRHLMLRLVVPGSGTPDSRRQLSLSDIVAAAPAQTIDPAVIRVLTEARLLSIDDECIQIAHEALLYGWPRLRRWIEESRDDLRVRMKISRAATDWENAQRDPDFLFRGTPLLTAMEWLAQNPGLLDPPEQGFLESSQRLSTESAAAEQVRKRRIRRLRRNALIALVVLSAGTSVSSLLAFKAYRESRHNATLAADATKAAEFRFASALGAAAYGQVQEDPRLALVLAAESMAMVAPTAAPYDTRSAMVGARQALEQGGPFLFGGPLVAGEALSIALNPQGSLLAIGSVDGTLELMDTANRRAVQAPVKDHEGGIRDIEFSPLGGSMVSSGIDGRLLHWQVGEDGYWRSQLLARARDVIVDVDFMPDGKSVISANDEGTVQRYYLDGRSEQPPPIAISSFGFNCIGISKDGRYLLTGNADRSISGYSLADGERVMGPLTEDGLSHLVSIEFNEDGTRFAALDSGGGARLFEFPGGRVADTAFSPDGPLGTLFFHPDKQRLIGGDDEGRLLEWDAVTGETRNLAAAGHSQLPRAYSLSADGNLLVTLGRDQIIRFWTLDDHFPLARQWRVPDGAAKGVGISLDGQRMAGGSDTGLVQIRRLGSVDRPLDLRGHAAAVWAVAFSDDGSVLASADRAGVIRIWNAFNGRLLQETALAGQSVWSLSFNPEGDVLLVGADDGVQQYSLTDRQWLQRLTTATGQLTRMFLSADGKILVTSDSSGRVAMLDTRSGQTLLDLEADNDTVWSVALSADGKFLAAASAGESVSIYDVSTAERIARLTGHSGGATDVAFLGDGATLIASDRKGHLHWWDLPGERRLVPPVKAHARAIWRLQVHPDGHRFISTGDDGQYRLWDVLDRQHACEIGLPGFDERRREQYLGKDRGFMACQR